LQYRKRRESCIGYILMHNRPLQNLVT
jgi:hypothetical protein